MAKKQATNNETVPATVPETETETSVKEKVVRMVQLEDGTSVNFGKRANVLTVADEQTNIVTFKLATGKIINWTVPFHDNLSGFVKSVYIYGLMSKIKSSLAPVKLEDLETAIGKAIVSLDAGVLTTRVSVANSLTIEQKAYATIKSVPGGRHFSEEYAHWSDLTSPSVVSEVIALWNTFDKSKKNAIRKDAYFRLEKGSLEAAATLEVSDI